MLVIMLLHRYGIRGTSMVFKWSNQNQLVSNISPNLNESKYVPLALVWSFREICSFCKAPKYGLSKCFSTKVVQSELESRSKCKSGFDCEKSSVRGISEISRIVEEFDDPHEEFDVKLDEFSENHSKLQDLSLVDEQSESLSKSASNSSSSKSDTLNKKQTKAKMTEKLLEEIRWRGRNQNFNHSLAAFIAVCMHTGHSGVAFDTFSHYQKMSEKKMSKYARRLTLEPYNEILKGLSTMGNHKKLKGVVACLKKAEIPPDINTFAHILSSIGRLDISESVKEDVQATLDWMGQCDIKIEDMFLTASFPGDATQHCFRAVQSVIPEADRTCFLYKDSQKFSSINQYNNPLLNQLNDSLLTNKVSSPAEGILSFKELKRRMDKQIENELKGFVEVSTIFKSSPDAESSQEKCLYKEWEEHWRKSLQSALIAQKKFMSDNFCKKSRGFDFYPYFIVLSNDEIVNLLLMEIKKLAMGSSLYSPTVNSLATDLGSEFYKRFLIKYKVKTNMMNSLHKIYWDYCTWYLSRSDPDSSYIPRVEWNRLVLKNIEVNNLKDFPPEWPYTLRASIGKLLYNIIFSRVMIWKPGEKNKDMFPAFYKIHRTQDMRLRDEIKPSPVLLETLTKTGLSTLSFQANLMPMVSPPVPWTSIVSGGYFACQSDFVRVIRHAQEQKKQMQMSPSAALFPVMDSLNQLASIPWKINTFLLDIIIEVFNKNGWEKMDICAHPSTLANPPKLTRSASKTERKEHFKRLSEQKKKKNEMNSLWHNMLYKLSIANWYRDEIIWLPQNMDFRGRTYPIPPHLTHLSSDVFRAILNFALGKKLGPEGLFWLKLHVVNLTGAKKRCSIQERLDYCDEVMNDIMDSADQPLKGRRWWAESEEPWQTLAACKELTNALRSGCPEEFVSHLPVHQDGSCNGLQHYAALGRDKKGAMSVNLSPSEYPQDVYSDVVELVEAERARDAIDGLSLAQALEGVVKRKVIKQTIMTNVYGVTKFGARLQILKQLNYLDDFQSQYLFSASTYLAGKTFSSLGSMFTATKEIQDWLSKIAVGVSKVCLNNVEWVTPLGFPVVQPYSKSANNPVIAGKILPTFNHDGFLKPNNLKQKNAFPPNFIHSLDSSHMMLTSLFCQHDDISFVSIHDCFWTHAASVQAMSKICRQQFVALHSQPILEDLAQYLIQKYSNHSGFRTNFTPITNADGTESLASLEVILKCVPPKGEFELKDVLDSVFFFS